MKLGIKQLNLLLEALRKYTRFGEKEGKSLTSAWTGLGSYSTYKPCVNAGLMTYATSPNSGYSTWWRLTDKGAKIVQAMLNMGYTHKSVENGWHEKGIHYNRVMAICPHSFFANETTNRAEFNEEKGVFVF